LQQLDSTRHNLVRNVDNDRGFHILDQRPFVFGVLWRRELPFASEPAQPGNNLRKADYREAERRCGRQDLLYLITPHLVDVPLGERRGVQEYVQRADRLSSSTALLRDAPGMTIRGPGRFQAGSGWFRFAGMILAMALPWRETQMLSPPSTQSRTAEAFFRNSVNVRVFILRASQVSKKTVHYCTEMCNLYECSASQVMVFVAPPLRAALHPSATFYCAP